MSALFIITVLFQQSLIEFVVACTIRIFTIERPPQRITANVVTNEFKRFCISYYVVEVIALPEFSFESWPARLPLGGCIHLWSWF